MDPETILCLRPQSEAAIRAVDDPRNKAFFSTILPPPEPSNAPVMGIVEGSFTSSISPDVPQQQKSSHSRESTPDHYSVHPSVLRIGFDTNIEHKPEGYYFGSSENCQIQMQYQDKTLNEGCYFRIQYNFSSGALLIVAISTIRIGSTRLKAGQSLLIMTDMIISCGKNMFQFVVEFPDLTNCAEAHEQNYWKYVKTMGLNTAAYLATCRDGDDPLGYEHRSKGELGQGSYGTVHKAVHIKTGELCAIKVLHAVNRNDRDKALKEVTILHKLSHKHVIKYEGSFEFKGNVYIVMELAANNLYSHINALQHNWLSLRVIREIMRQALAGIQYMHSRGFAHRDLKPANILLTEWNRKTGLPVIKIADFGLSTIKPSLTTPCGTPGYWAPEISAEIHCDSSASRSFHYDKSVDIYSIGRVLMELLAAVPDSLEKFKAPGMNLAQQMQSKLPKDRPTAEACLEHAWLKVKDNLGISEEDRSSNAISSVMKRTLPNTSSFDDGRRIRRNLNEAFKEGVKVPESRGPGARKGNSSQELWSLFHSGKRVPQDSVQESTQEMTAKIEEELGRSKSPT